MAVMAFITASLSAQDYGNIYGTVTDTEGNPLPGVSVTISSAYYPTRTIVTSETGEFRFLRLPVASDYVLTFELTGFKTVTREKIRVVFGSDVRLNIQMEMAPVAETIVVTAQTPLIDTKKAQVGVTVTKEMLMDLPTARNPWVLMDLMPGVLVDRVDVGGHEGGQQSAYYGHGSAGSDNTWTVDGGNITDMSALGAAPAYLNVSGYEEMTVNYGANDIANPTGGVQINLVSKRGGNNYSGTFFLDFERESWQLENVTDELKKVGYKSPGTYKTYLYGANFGGPILKDKAWFYASWGIQDIDKRTLVHTHDATWLESGYAKLNFQITKDIRAEGFLEYDNKLKWGRTAYGPEYQAPETLWDQTGPGYIYKGEVEGIFGNLLLTAKAIYTDGGFQLKPRGWGSGNYMVYQYSPTFYVYGNFENYGTDRNQLDLTAYGSYFAENLFGGDHEIKFGVDYLTATVTTYDLYENNVAIAAYKDFDYYEAWIVRDYIINYAMDRYSAFLQDTFTLGKFTLNLGVRFDQTKSMVKNENVPAAPLMSQFLPALKIDKLDPKVKWQTISPRFSIAYDIFGTGKDVIKLSLARYGTQTSYEFADFLNPIGWSEIDLEWRDLNKDGKVTENELFGADGTQNIYDYTNWLWFGGFDPRDPKALKSPNKLDPDYSSPLLDEVMLSYQKEIMTDFAARLELFYKKRHNLTWNRGIFADGHIESENDYTVWKSVTGEGITKNVYKRSGWPIGTYRSNSKNQYETYMAAQLVLTKRLSNKWMMDASFTYSDWKSYYGGDYLNPTNVDFYDGGVVAPQSGGSGYTGIYVNSRWMAKLAGLYQLPYGINISGSLIAREGYIIPRYRRITGVPNIGTVNVYFGKMGDTRLPAFWIANLRVEKIFNIKETKVVVAVDGFNITNNNMALKKEPNIGAKDYMQTKMIVPPGIFRIGIRFEF